MVNNVPERVGGANQMAKNTASNRADRVVNYELIEPHVGAKAQLLDWNACPLLSWWTEPGS